MGSTVAKVISPVAPTLRTLRTVIPVTHAADAEDAKDNRVRDIPTCHAMTLQVRKVADDPRLFTFNSRFTAPRFFVTLHP